MISIRKFSIPLAILIWGFHIIYSSLLPSYALTGFDCSTVSEIPQSECQELIDLYDSTNGDYWTNNNGWKQSNTPCSWYGVTCSSNHVTELMLSENNLSGHITDIQLHHLKRLDMSINDLNGTVPNFTGVPQLIYLNLGSNYSMDLGNIPDFSNLPELQELHLNSTSLTGSIPDFSNLPQLRILNLTGNSELSGNIPNFSNIPNLTELYLNFAHLNGDIPDFSNLSNLQILNVESNQLSGHIPDFSNLPQLKELYLNNNNLDGNIPDFVGIPNLVILNISQNQLNGTIPNFSNLPNLTSFKGNYNQLHGNLPNFSNLPNLQILNLSFNQLDGDIPNFSNLQNLQQLYLHSNHFSGTIPDFTNLTYLQRLALSENQLSGTIPEFSHLSQLEHLGVDYNQLSGIIPSELCNSSITEAYFSYNKFDIWQTDNCISSLDANWTEYQTVPPRDVTATALTGDSVHLSWNVIPYSEDGGYYGILSSTSSGGPYELIKTTDSKFDNSTDINNLVPGNTYYFVVYTFTPAHDYQQNDLTSENSDEVLVMLTSVSTSGNDVILTWTPSAYFSQYEILYNTSPYFTPNDSGTIVETTTNSSWTHSGVAANANNNFFYLQRGVTSDGVTSNTFNRMGKFTFLLNGGN